MKPFGIILAAAMALGASGLASAAEHPNTTSKALGGIITANGTIAYGSGFKLYHPSTGEYVIEYNANTFKQCPVVSLQPAGIGANIPVANLYGYTCSGGSVTMTIGIYSMSGSGPMDNAFHFTMTQI